MKKRFALMTAVLLCVILLSVILSPAKLPTAAMVASAGENENSTRFLNMLNHNFAYDEDFNTFEGLTHSAVLANLPLREGDYISESYIKGYLFDMYGINAVEINDNAGEKSKEGYVYIVPTGFSRYEHKNAVVTENEDGTFTVITDVLVSAHDDIPYETECVSLFAKSEKSSFGYTLIYSNLNPETADY